MARKKGKVTKKGQTEEEAEAAIKNYYVNKGCFVEPHPVELETVFEEDEADEDSVPERLAAPAQPPQRQRRAAAVAARAISAPKEVRKLDFIPFHVAHKERDKQRHQKSVQLFKSRGKKAHKWQGISEEQEARLLQVLDNKEDEDDLEDDLDDDEEAVVMQASIDAVLARPSVPENSARKDETFTLDSCNTKETEEVDKRTADSQPEDISKANDDVTNVSDDVTTKTNDDDEIKAGIESTLAAKGIHSREDVTKTDGDVTNVNDDVTLEGESPFLPLMPQSAPKVEKASKRRRSNLFKPVQSKPVNEIFDFPVLPGEEEEGGPSPSKLSKSDGGESGQNARGEVVGLLSAEEEEEEARRRRKSFELAVQGADLMFGPIDDGSRLSKNEEEMQRNEESEENSAKRQHDDDEATPSEENTKVYRKVRRSSRFFRAAAVASSDNSSSSSIGTPGNEDSASVVAGSVYTQVQMVAKKDRRKSRRSNFVIFKAAIDDDSSAAVNNSQAVATGAAAADNNSLKDTAASKLLKIPSVASVSSAKSESSKAAAASCSSERAPLSPIENLI